MATKVFLYLISHSTACIDHRGTPENPARTLTLEHREGSVCVSFEQLQMFIHLQISWRLIQFHLSSFIVFILYNGRIFVTLPN